MKTTLTTIFHLILTAMIMIAAKVSATFLKKIYIKKIYTSKKEIEEEKLKTIKEEKKKYATTDIYNTIDKEFEEKIKKCIEIRNKERIIDLEEAIKIENELHETILTQLKEIEEQILQNIKDNGIKNIKSIKTFRKTIHINISRDTKFRVIAIFPDIISIISLKEYILSETKKLDKKYINFLILLLFIKTKEEIFADNKELQKAFELEKEEMIILEKLKYMTEEDFIKNSPTLIETLENFAEIVRIIFKEFNISCSATPTKSKEEKKEKLITQVNVSPDSETQKTEEIETQESKPSKARLYKLKNKLNKKNT